jgi:hypothetical protein
VSNAHHGYQSSEYSLQVLVFLKKNGTDLRKA